MLIEVITRTNRRPMLLAVNRSSMRAQTSDAWVQTILEGAEGQGMAVAQGVLASYGQHLRGDYIWILDDDDKCCRPTLVEELLAIIEEHQPDVIMLRMDHGPRGVLPDRAAWGQRPMCGRIGVSGYVVRREMWQKYAHLWLTGLYSTDFDFINGIFESDPSVYWHDVIASQVQAIGLGRSEREIVEQDKIRI